MLATGLCGETQGAERCCLLSLLEAACSVLLPASLFGIQQAEGLLPSLRWETALSPMTTELSATGLGKV